MTSRSLPDPRRHAYRVDLAAEELRGTVDVPRYVRGEPRQIAAPCLPLRREPRFDSLLETEALLGEIVTLFDERDGPDAPPVVIVSESLANRYFSGESALGRRVVLGDETAEIVGIVGDIRRASLDDAPRADMYLPFERNQSASTGLFIRTTGEPAATLPAVPDEESTQDE